MSKRKFMRPQNVIIGVVVAALAGKAVYDQLQMPPKERTWQGTVVGIPYDFRIPTVERIINNVWNKDTSRVFMPKVFGLGWDINVYALLHRVQG